MFETLLLLILSSTQSGIDALELYAISKSTNWAVHSHEAVIFEAAERIRIRKINPKVDVPFLERTVPRYFLP